MRHYAILVCVICGCASAIACTVTTTEPTPAPATVQEAPLPDAAPPIDAGRDTASNDPGAQMTCAEAQTVCDAADGGTAWPQFCPFEGGVHGDCHTVTTAGGTVWCCR